MASPLLVTATADGASVVVRRRLTEWVETLSPGGGGAAAADDAEERGRATHGAMVATALQLAVLPAAARASSLDEIKGMLYPAVAAQCSACSGAALPLALLQALLPRLLGSGEAAGMLLQPLLDALQTTDAASATAVELAAELALAHSDHVLPDVISLLDSAVAAQRSNALAILASAARLCTAADVSGAAAARLGGPRAAQALALALLPRLADEQLAIRTDAAALFAALDPSFIVPRLAPLLVGATAERAAAEAALLAALRAHRDAAALVAVLIDVSRDAAAAAAAPTAPVATPGEIGPRRDAPSGAAAPADAAAGAGADGCSKLEDRLLRVVAKWAAGLDGAGWRAALGAAAVKFFGAAEDASSSASCASCASSPPRGPTSASCSPPPRASYGCCRRPPSRRPPRRRAAAASLTGCGRCCS